MTAKNTEQLLFLNTAKIFISIEDNDTVTTIERKINQNRSWIVKIVNQLQKEKIIIRVEHGREKYITLTTKGKIIQEHIRKIISLLKGK